MSDIDIIDQIDALVDEQLANYDNRSGYDHDVNQERCGHCCRDWHGLAAENCPGSAFIGPLPPPEYATGGVIHTAPLGTPLPTDDVFDPSAWANIGIADPGLRFRHTPRSMWSELLHRQLIEFMMLDSAIVALGGTWNNQWTIEEARAERDRLVAGHTADMTLNEAIQYALHFQGVPYDWGVGSDVSGPFAVGGFRVDVEVSEPDTRTPQQRALPRPSTTPPMWANDVTRSRRPRRNRNQPNRQGIA
ncbi:hypothetical protein [Rhodococcoides fascians]|uniref:hypothetical protein n=1 Tax=Rhodococcoides fascians TaxID=1828 RepID=UPI00050BDD3A|nr:hypothetical protein [Rhodococcus fascians]